jgi:putative membrane protein insertion efficiency factor
MKNIIISIITLYQKVFSPTTGIPHTLGLVKSPVCRFLPTCSEYTKEAIEKYGVIKGLQLGVRRIYRCRGGLPGEYDPVK